jgi:hypothetical protein
MFRITKAQQLALKRKAEQVRHYDPKSDFANYRFLRRRVQVIFASGGAITVFWCNMWLAIEPDGYTHS